MITRSLFIKYVIVLVLILLATLSAGELLVRLTTGPPAKLLYTGPFRDRQTDWDVSYGIDETLRRRSCGPIDKNLRKVAVIGDSFVFGQGVPDCKDFVSLLNQAQKGFHFENFGIIGIGSPEYLQISRDLVSKDYDKVIIVFYGNDFFWKKTFPSEIASHSSLISLVRKFRRQSIVRTKLDESLSGKEPFNNLSAAVRKNASYEFDNVEPDEASISAFKKNFEMIVEDLAGKVGYDSIYVAVAPSGHVVSPSVRNFLISIGGKPAPFGKEGNGYEEIKKLAGHKGLHFIETFQEFLKCGDGCYFTHDIHWTEHGHSVMAQTVSKMLRETEESDLVQ